MFCCCCCHWCRRHRCRLTQFKHWNMPIVFLKSTVSKVFHGNHEQNMQMPLPQAIILLLHFFFNSHIYHYLKYFHLHTNRFFILIPHLCQINEKKNSVSQEQEKRFPFNSLEIFVGKSSITNFMVMIVLHVLRILKNDRRRYLKYYIYRSI